MKNISNCRLKIIIFFILLILNTSQLFCQIDIYKTGLDDCLAKDEILFIDSLNLEIVHFLKENFRYSSSNYKEFLNNYCLNEYTNSQFKIEENSALAQLIKKGISNKFWIYDEYDPNEPLIIDGEEVIIIPPGQSEFKPKPKSVIEQSSLNPNGNLVNCNKVYVLQRMLANFYIGYERMRHASSSTKLCVMMEFFENEDYDLDATKYFVLIDGISQKIIHENNYYRFFKN